REMLMKLCENQNALLAGTFTGSTLSLPVSTPLPVVASVVASATEKTLDTLPDVVFNNPVEPPAPPQQEALNEVPSEVVPVADDEPVDLFEYVRSLMAKAVEMHATDIDPDQNFMELGADSMTAMSMVKDMETRYNIELPATLLFEYATLNELVDFLKEEIGDAADGSARSA
ncbi:MAG: acyl carrier protein, partial [Gammaproteobacteria bacterium]